MKRVLLTGATGNVATELVKCLQKDHVKLLAAVQEPDKPAPHLPSAVERVRFVFGDEATYAPALRGVDAVFLLRPPRISDAKRFILPAIDAMKAARVRAVTFLSVQGAHGKS